MYTQWRCRTCDHLTNTRTELEDHLNAEHGVDAELDPAGFEKPTAVVTEPKPTPPARKRLAKRAPRKPHQ